MPVELEADPRTTVRVLPAPVVELGFCCYVAEKGAPKGSANGPSWVFELSRQQPELLQRLAAFWSEETFHEWAEILVLAQRSGTVFAHPEAFLTRLEEVASEPYEVPDMPSEPDGVREIVQDRLDRLAASPELRAEYVALLREFWEALKPYWRPNAARVADDLVGVFRQRLSKNEDVRTLLPRNHFARRTIHTELVAAAVERGEVVLVPLALGGGGMAFFSLPGLLLIGVGPEAEKRQDRKREAAERAAARFKVLADPTRLAILGSFCSNGASISDLAETFDLSQPTVSVHVKMLREAGLLEATKMRGQTVYRSSRERVAELLDDAVGELFSG